MRFHGKFTTQISGDRKTVLIRWSAGNLGEGKGLQRIAIEAGAVVVPVNGYLVWPGGGNTFDPLPATSNPTTWPEAFICIGRPRDHENADGIHLFTQEEETVGRQP